MIVLFSFADAYADESGIWTVKMSCSPEAMEYMFNIEKIGYLRYKLKNIIKLQSRYSYLIYLYIEKNKFRKKWRESLDDLKEILKCNIPYYEHFKEFNRYVLKPSNDEINSITDCRYSYTTIKQGRKVVAIEFTIENTSIEYAEQGELEGIGYISEEESQIAKFYSYAVDNSFNENEIRIIIKKLENVPGDKLPTKSIKNYPDTLKRYHFLKDKYKEMKETEKETKIENRLEYILSLL